MNYGGGRAKGDHVYNEDGAVLIKAHGPIAGDDLAGGELERLVGVALANGRAVCESGAAAYVCATWRTYSIFERAILQAALGIHACIVWNKGWIGLGHQHYRPQHEFILYARGNWYAGADESDVWSISRDPATSYLHPTQKPVELIERCLVNSSAPGAVVLDLFAGSGSTIIACERRKRRCMAIELSPDYVDVAVRRWQEFTGERAINHRTGEAFPE
jgi:DNA modification methylase